MCSGQRSASDLRFHEVKDKKTAIKKTEKKAKKKKPKKEKRVEKIKTTKAKPKVEKPQYKPDRYWEAVGRRKTAVARVRLFSRGEKEVLINEKPYQEYFSDIELLQTVVASLKKMNSLERFRVVSKVKGGGLSAQAEALRHGIARALVKFNPDFRVRLKKSGFLTRDPRMRERKKFGLKRARRAPQWKKR